MHVQAPRFTRYLDDESNPLLAGKALEAEGWIAIPDIDANTSFLSKPLKPVILETGTALMLYKIGEDFYCSDAYSTA
jgi:hypothetical protein